MTQAATTLDPNVLRFNQICIVGGIALAALLGQWWIVALVGLVMVAGTLDPRLAAFKRLYTGVVRPALGVRANAVEDDPRAHNFAQGVGGAVLAAATLAFAAGAPVLGWALAVGVAALATLNLTTGVCVGCFLYFQLRRLQYRLRRA